MRKNVAGQTIGVQMVSASDGSAFTGTVSAFVTGDAGTQGAGGGSVTHEGNGYHSYSITQAETNFDHVAVTFTGTGAIPATVQVYTSFPQTGDSFARLGAPAGASVSADIAGVQADTNDIQTRIPAALVSGRIDASVGAMAANTLTASALATDAVTEIQSGLATASALATVDDFIDTEVAAILAAVDTEVAAIKAKTDSLTFTVAGVVDANIQRINDVAVTGNGQAGTEFNV